MQTLYFEERMYLKWINKADENYIEVIGNWII